MQKSERDLFLFQNKFISYRRRSWNVAFSLAFFRPFLDYDFPFLIMDLG